MPAASITTTPLPRITSYNVCYTKLLRTDSGQTGIKLVKEKSASLSRYDLIVIEVKLPDINGVQVIRNARALPMFSETAIAVISNVNNDRIIMAARGSGAIV